jgi:hypothetical protein
MHYAFALGDRAAPQTPGSLVRTDAAARRASVQDSHFPEGVLHRPERAVGLRCSLILRPEGAMQIKEYLDFLVMLIPTCVLIGAVALTLTIL